MAHNVAPVAPNGGPMAHNVTPVAHTIALVAPPYYSLYIQPPPPHPFGYRSKVGIPRGRNENHENIHSLFFGVLVFDFFISLCFTVNNRRRGALA